MKRGLSLAIVLALCGCDTGRMIVGGDPNVVYGCPVTFPIYLIDGARGLHRYDPDMAAATPIAELQCGAEYPATGLLAVSRSGQFFTSFGAAKVARGAVETAACTVGNSVSLGAPLRSYTSVAFGIRDEIDPNGDDLLFFSFNEASTDTYIGRASNVGAVVGNPLRLYFADGERSDELCRTRNDMSAVAPPTCDGPRAPGRWSYWAGQGLLTVFITRAGLYLATVNDESGEVSTPRQITGIADMRAVEFSTAVWGGWFYLFLTPEDVMQSSTSVYRIALDGSAEAMPLASVPFRVGGAAAPPCVRNLTMVRLSLGRSGAHSRGRRRSR